MKKLILSFALLSISWSSLLATKVYYTSGKGQGTWQDPASWVLGGTNEQPSTPPSAEDHVVIGHYLIHRINGTYTHEGTIKVTDQGMYEVATNLLDHANFAFAGDYFEVEGTFFSSADLTLLQSSHLIVHRSAYFYLGGSLTMAGQGGMISESETCGSVEIHRDLKFVSAEGYVAGKNRLIVSGTLRLWNDQGREINPEMGISAQVAERLGEDVQLYHDVDACGMDRSFMQGTSEQLLTGVTWAAFEVETISTEAELVWHTSHERFVADFVVERSEDGIVFETVAQIPARGQDGMGQSYRFTDRLPEQGTVTYRIRQNTISGAYSHSEKRQASRRVEATALVLYPNPSRAGRVNLLGQGLNQSAIAHLSVRTPAGHLVHQATVQTDYNGRVELRGLPGLAPGLYLVMLQQGDTRLVERLLIH
jgi:hypothetical protein